MPKKVPLISITVHREKRPVDVPVNKPFDFTEEEVEQIEAAVPGSLRDPVNEVNSQVTAAATPPAGKGKAGKGADGDL